jgi:hypothetical protein
MQRRPIRLALLLDSWMQPAWIRTLIGDVRSLPFAEIALIVMNDTAPAPRRSFTERLAAYRKDLLYLLYMRLDAWRVRSKADPFELGDVSDLLAGIPIVRVTPRQTQFCDYFTDSDVATIRGYDLDVALRLGFRIIKGDALRIAKHGVWSYHHGDNLVNRGGPPGFWEVVEHQSVTGSVLQILSDELDNGRVIYRSYSATNPYSVTENRRGYYWKSAAFVTRKLRDLYDGGPETLGCDAQGYEAYSNRLYQQPTNSEMLRFLPRLVGRYTKEKIRGMGTREQWFLAYKFRPRADLLDVPHATLYNFKILEPPLDRFWADPFPVLREGRYHLFFEEYLYSVGRAHISVLTFGDDGRPGAAQVALATDHHLSYPNVFEWKNELYMLPEAAESGRVQLYRCVEFPHRWEPAAVLLEDTAGVDPTLVESDGRWWLFVTLAEPRTHNWNDELYLYYADTPLGPWKPHSRNPVKSDVRGARPAGRIFARDGRLYRPAQDCSVRYGYGITVHEITRLDEVHYQEVPVSIIRPDWHPGLLGVHTLNAAGNLTVVDGQWRRNVLRSRSRHGFSGAPQANA